MGRNNLEVYSLRFCHNKLVDLRLLSGFTQAELAEELDVSLRTYQNWEYGINVPSQKNLRKIEKFFNTSFTFRSII